MDQNLPRLYTYCERCGCTRLDVHVASVALIEFDDDEPDGQMQELSGCDFDDGAKAQCSRCGLPGTVGGFRHVAAHVTSPAAWTADFDAAASSEGWSLFDGMAERCIDRLDAPAEGQPALPDQYTAWRIVLTGKRPHHARALAIVEKTSPQHWKCLMAFKAGMACGQPQERFTLPDLGLPGWAGTPPRA
jgi:hypothetical protein